MTKFFVYNVQLLPTSTKVEDVGPAGYKRLFSLLRETNRKHRKEQTLPLFHFKLSADTFFGPAEFNFGAGFVSGNFIKYTRTNIVSDINRGKAVYVNKTRATTVSRQANIPFLFDSKHHYLAIEGDVVLSPAIMIKALHGFFKEAMSNSFPAHELHINLLSAQEDIEQVLNSATAFKKITLDVTFQNGGHNTQEFLADLRESRTQKLHVEASGGDGKIAKMPDFLSSMVRAAALVGTLHMTYYVSSTAKKQTYNSLNSPLTFIVRRSANDDDASYLKRVKTKLLRATNKAEIDATESKIDISAAEPDE
ncbi:DUF4747 family protein [Variovorax sp. CY25R-8]|uniref:DUF4747 family protein n=1 Tax=Variovorax sp. CY25R-8 TaxID=2855501 RepID=UPI0021BB4DBB|nr:DUF4747 family protein [Variovorax sp. CY25R-8]MCT8176720.1 DUF4747 family protein [Variovorax sp. CY25R-8]